MGPRATTTEEEHRIQHERDEELRGSKPTSFVCAAVEETATGTDLCPTSPLASLGVCLARRRPITSAPAKAVPLGLAETHPGQEGTRGFTERERRDKELLHCITSTA